MKEFMDFHESAVKVFGQNLLSLVKPEQKKMVHSDAKLDLLLHVIDMLVVLDALKDMKAGLLNDFSRFKRFDLFYYYHYYLFSYLFFNYMNY